MIFNAAKCRGGPACGAPAPKVANQGQTRVSAPKLFLGNQVIEQIHSRRLDAELPDHPDDLPAMKRRVVDDVLHLFDERQRERLAFQVLIAQVLTQSLLGHTSEQLSPIVFYLAPPRAQF